MKRRPDNRGGHIDSDLLTECGKSKPAPAQRALRPVPVPVSDRLAGLREGPTADPFSMGETCSGPTWAAAPLAKHRAVS